MPCRCTRPSCAAILGTALLVSAGLGAFRARAAHIDTFDDATSFNLSPIPAPLSEPFLTPSTPVSITQTAADGIDPAVTLGGERFIMISGGSWSVPNTQKQSAGDFISFSMANTLASGTLLLDYGRSTPLSDGAGGIDFDTQWDNVTVSVTFARDGDPAPGKLPNGDLTVVIESGDHAGGTLASGSARQTVFVAGNFAFAFNHPGYAGVDFTDVTQVTVSLFDGGLDGFSYVIGGITREAVVPEPTALALSLLGLGVVALRSRQR